MKFQYAIVFSLIFSSSNCHKHSKQHHGRRLHDEPIEPFEPIEPVEPDESVDLTSMQNTGVEIVKWHTYTFIQSRFATTIIVSKFKNHDQESRETKFLALLPDAAFISNISLEMNGRTIYGQVKEKNAAQQTYERHKSMSKFAGIVIKGIRETNVFEVSVNMEPRTEVTVKLMYEEILQRVHGVYKNVIHVQPGRIVRDLKIRVEINENVEIVDLRVPKFEPKRGEMENIELLEITKAEKIFANVNIEAIDDIAANKFRRIIQYHPNHIVKENLKTNSGQFVVLYDVVRDDKYPKAFQVVDGWFVHFFAPKVDIGEVLNKNIVFIMDTSGSMAGEKLKQTKDALKSILEQLSEVDYFNIVIFSSKARLYKSTSLSVTEANIEDAIRYIESLEAKGGTNIDQAMKLGLDLLSQTKSSSILSMIVFMTDGRPTWGQYRPDKIMENIKNANIGDRSKVAIHTMAFGKDADFNLMKRIALNNNGIVRRIYEGSDADLQLQGFCAQFFTPLLTNVTIEYLNGSVEVGKIVEDSNGISYYGSEHMIVGKLNKQNNQFMRARITANGNQRTKRRIDLSLNIKPVEPISNTQSHFSALRLTSFGGFIERMWAYKTIKQLLDMAKFVEQDPTKKDALKARALTLSLQYNFVTELTSMVVVVNETALPTVLLPSPSLTKYENKRTLGRMAWKKEETALEEALCEGEFDVWRPHGILCDATCTTPHNESSSQCGKPACGCKKGYTRIDSYCIPLEDCSNLRCTSNQEATECYTSKLVGGTKIECQSTCTYSADDDPSCNFRCGSEFKCVCRVDYVSSSQNTCIARDSCSSSK